MERCVSFAFLVSSIVKKKWDWGTYTPSSGWQKMKPPPPIDPPQWMYPLQQMYPVQPLYPHPPQWMYPHPPQLVQMHPYMNQKEPKGTKRKERARENRNLKI